MQLEIWAYNVLINPHLYKVKDQIKKNQVKIRQYTDKKGKSLKLNKWQKKQKRNYTM